MALFYRVENENKEGPYQTSISITDYLYKKFNKHSVEDQLEFSEQYHAAHPTPWNDPLLSNIWFHLNNKMDFIFGFKSLDDVFNWFCLPEELSYLSEFGFQISIYEVEESYNGKWQSIALRKSLKHIDCLKF